MKNRLFGERIRYGLHQPKSQILLFLVLKVLINSFLEINFAIKTSAKMS